MYFLARRCAPGLRLVSATAAILASAALSACGSMDGGRSFLQSVRPYQVAVVQGNFVSSEQVQALKPGMSRQQVRDILGTPLLASVFHADRWDYVFTLHKQGQEAQTRKLTVFFQGDTLQRHEGDEMPSEAEFVATLGSAKASKKVPVLEASAEQLARYPQPDHKGEANTHRAPSAPAASGASRSYPPLEAAQ